MSVRTRGGRYVVDYYPHGSKGKRVRLTLPLGTTEAQAHSIWQGLVNRKHASSFIGQGDPIDRLARYYYDYVKMHLSPRTCKDIQSCFINHIVPFFGKMHTFEIVSPIITVYQKHRIGEDASKEQRAINRTINKELSYFSTFLRWVEDQTGAMINVKIKPLPYKRPLPAILSQEDIDILIKKTEFEYKGIMMALAHLGLRIGSARHIKWPDVNFETKTIRAVLKGGREIYLPMTDELYAWLKKQKTENIYNSPWAFPSRVRPMRPIADIRDAITRAKDAAGITKRIHPHLFRHSAAAHLLESGVDIRVVQEILGHTDIRMTEWYTQVSQRLKKQALTRSGRIKDSHN